VILRQLEVTLPREPEIKHPLLDARTTKGIYIAKRSH
jgi:hypothetical protein